MVTVVTIVIKTVRAVSAKRWEELEIKKLGPFRHFDNQPQPLDTT